MIGDIPAGTKVDGRYEIVGRIGSGGMADVYRAHDTQLGRDVALKLLHRRFAEDEEFVERFRREASHAAGLAHPNIVGIYDRGEWDGTSYIAMELLEGRTLKEIVAADGPLPPAQAIDLCEQVLRAARFAHRRGIVHRDLKPHNVVVDGEGRAKVADFGIARAAASDMTQTGSIMGTAQYLSPEQAQGEAVTPRSDLYSVGVVLYEMLTGRVPFQGDSAVQIAMQQVSTDPVPPSQVVPGLPAELEAVVLKALAKDPAARYPDADAFLAALERARAAMAGAGGPATTAFAPVGAVHEEVVVEEEPEEPRGRRRAALIGLAVLLALLLAAGVYALTRPDQRLVPEVRGQTVGSAVEQLKNRGFEVDIERIESRDVERGDVIRQDPAGGERADEGSTVTLVVSQGAGRAEVPSVRGQPRSAARRALRRAGFVIREERQSSDAIRENRAIETSPDAGVQVEVGTTVTLVVSSGPELVTVADVVGSQAEEAQTRLRDAGLSVSTTEVETEDREAGTVLRQSPAGGTRVRPGATVALTVATEPERVEVPDVTGLDESDAVSRLESAGLQVTSRSRDTTEAGEDGVVLSQSPRGGRDVRRGARVTITVGAIRPEDTGTPVPDEPTGTTPEDPTLTTETTP